MGFWSGESEKKIDEDYEKSLSRLFKELDKETDSAKKKIIMKKITKIQEEYKDKKKKKSKWKFFQ